MDFKSSFLLSAPHEYPTHIEIHPHTDHSVYVHWRGISTIFDEESLEGYIVSESIDIISSENSPCVFCFKACRDKSETNGSIVYVSLSTNIRIHRVC